MICVQIYLFVFLQSNCDNYLMQRIEIITSRIMMESTSKPINVPATISDTVSTGEQQMQPITTRLQQ